MKTKRYILYITYYMLYAICHAQNLVPNPSFEDTVHCPTAQNQIYNAQNWINPTAGSPDYFNSCYTVAGGVGVPSNALGNQSAHIGNAYAGAYLYNPSGREYIQTQLTAILIANHAYSVSFYVSLGDGCQYAISSIGAYFSSNPITSSNANRLPYMPQAQNKQGVLTDKNNWTLVIDSFLANGNELYITIGNFNVDSMSDTLFLGNIGGINDAYYYIDDISVIDLGLSSGIGHLKNKNEEISIYPNPGNSKFILSGFDADQKNVSIEVTDVAGKQVFKQQSVILNSSVELNLFLDNGIYFVNIINASGIKEVHKIVITN